MAKKQKKVYQATDEDMECHSFAVRNNFAVVKKPIPDRYGYYWLINYNTEDYKNVRYYRMDKSKPDSKNNREVFTEYEADEKMFEILKQFYNLKMKKNGNN